MPDLHNEAPQPIVESLLSGNMHFQAWCAVVDALSKADPTWCRDGSKSAVENAVAWIKAQGERHA